MHSMARIMGAAALSLLAIHCRSESRNEGTEPTPETGDQAKVTALRRCTLDHLQPKDPTQPEWVVSGFDLVEKFAQCQADSGQNQDRHLFQLAMDGFSEPVPGSPSQFRVIASPATAP